MPQNEPTERNRTLAALLQSIAGLLEARRENPHRIKAYRRAAETLLGLGDDVAEVAERGALQDLPGIGRDLSAKIEEFLQTGTIQTYEALKTPLPPDVAAWATLPGLSEALVHHLYFRLGIRTLSDLELLARSHLLRTMQGMRDSEDNLLNAIEARKTTVKDKDLLDPCP